MIIVFLRTLILFVLVILSMRLMGKRQLGELELSELVVTVLIADMAALPLQDLGVPLLNGIIPVVTLLCCELILSGITMHSVRARAILFGKPSILVSDGVISQREMRKNRFTLDEFAEELRNQSVTDISKVKYAILEADGRLNTILFPGEQPVTAAQMNVAVEDPGSPSIIINDGKVIEENLRLMGKDDSWLRRELRKHKAGDIRSVYLLTLNNAGQVYYAPMER